MAQLTYFIKDAYLVGDVDGKHFQFKAVSGGRGGSLPDSSVRHVVNNPYLVGQTKNESKSITGGPLPCGTYTLRPDLNRRSQKDKNRIVMWIDLIPDESTSMGRRTGGFAIHGRGERGSDGCIVPTDPLNLTSLYKAVLEEIKAKTGTIKLKVVAGDLADIA